jgi:DNA primase
MYDDNREKAEKVLDYLEIRYETPTRNALNVQCPFCDDESAHCGIFLDRLTFSCWKCKASGSFFALVHEHSNIDVTTYKDIIGSDFKPQEKSTVDIIADIVKGEDSQFTEGRASVEWPPKGTVPVSKMRDDYQVQAFIKKRGFDKLYENRNGYQFAAEEGVRIGVTGRYAGRFIVPVYNEGVIVAYQARDMVGKAEAKYLSEGDVSFWLYNIDRVDGSKPIAITEGIFDTWAVEAAGFHSVASFTTGLSDQQIQMMLDKDPPYWILCWDMGSDGSDAFWKGRVMAKNLSAQFGPGKMRAVELPPGEDIGSVGEEARYYLDRALEVM